MACMIIIPKVTTMNRELVKILRSLHIPLGVNCKISRKSSKVNVIFVMLYSVYSALQPGPGQYSLSPL